MPNEVKTPDNWQHCLIHTKTGDIKFAVYFEGAFYILTCPPLPDIVNYDDDEQEISRVAGPAEPKKYLPKKDVLTWQALAFNPALPAHPLV